MIVRINWLAWKNQPISADQARDPNRPADMYHVYQCDNYMVETLGYNGSSNGDSGPSRINLFLNGRTEGAHQLALSNGDEAFIMNDAGKTIDIIRTV